MNKVIQAQRKDKKAVVDILSQSFATDPQVSWIVGNEPKKEKRMRRLMAYAFELAMVNGSVQLTADKKAVAIWRNHRSKRMSGFLFIEMMNFALAFGSKRLSRISKMERQVVDKYPKDKDFKYLWFLGTLPTEQGKGYGSALLKPALEDCASKNQNVYLETSTKSNVAYYEKKGFKIYDSVTLGEGNPLLVYLLRTNYTT
ncbi:MAG: GNAT family N-acetyltransferase [Thermonemataceae bacterium]